MSALLSALLRDACACLILKMASVSLEVQRCGRGRAGVLVGLELWMVMRFVCVIRVITVCRCAPVCPVCVPALPDVFLPEVASHTAVQNQASGFLTI